MNDDERAQILVAARVLDAARKIDWLSTGLTLIAAFTERPEGIALGLIAKYFAVRIALDARLFDDIAAGRLTTNAFDDGAVALRLMPAKKAARSWSDRCRGAMRLVTILAVITVAQAIALCVRSFL